MPSGKWGRLSHMSVCWKRWNSTSCQHLKLIVDGYAEPLCRRSTFNILVSTSWGDLVSMSRPTDRCRAFVDHRRL